MLLLSATTFLACLMLILVGIKSKRCYQSLRQGDGRETIPSSPLNLSLRIRITATREDHPAPGGGADWGQDA